MLEYIHHLNSLLEKYRVYRIGPFSAVDTIGAYVGVLLLAPFIKWGVRKLGFSISVLELLAMVLPVALVFHVLFGIDSAFTQMVFTEGNYAAKAIVFFMALFACKRLVWTSE